MIDIKRTNRFSCVLDSFAMAAGVEPSRLIDLVGHLGYRVETDNEKNYTVPLGYHIQELIAPMMSLGFSVTPVELYPVTYDEGLESNRIIWFGTGEDKDICNKRRLFDAMQNQKGILTGRNQIGNGHAVAWVDGMAHDPVAPCGRIYDIFDIHAETGSEYNFNPRAPFQPSCFWRVTR